MTALVASLIIALGVCDIWLTSEVLKKGGSEANPIMKWLMDYSPISWEWVKLCVHIIVATAVFTYPALFTAGVVFCAIYVLICLWNLKVLKGM
jgi:hypothetical protein